MPSSCQSRCTRLWVTLHPSRVGAGMPCSDPSGCAQLRSSGGDGLASLLNVEDPAGMALGAAMLPHHPVDKAFRRPVTLLQDLDGPAIASRAPKFPSARILSIAFSSSASARSFFRLVFSLSSWVSRLAPLDCIPPYCCRQR